MVVERGVQVVAILAAIIFIAFGLWSFFDPSSFFDEVATFEPYNEHLLHDIGAFQIGVGAGIVFALIWRNDALLAALAGAGVGATFHFISHVQDHGEGGREGDPYLLGLLAAVIVAAAVARWAARRSSETPVTWSGADL
jgi:peptidoglycan/LPS O-acetylase OafA/YrhL